MKIAAPYRPFSHEPGIRLVLPYTHHFVTAYPTRLEVGSEVIAFPWTGPVKGFTTELDLEHGRIEGWGEAREGYFRYRLEGAGDQWDLTFIRGLGAGEKKPLSFTRAPLEKLSLGSHKKQEWEGVQKRSDPVEYFPFWYALGQQVRGVDLSLTFADLQLLWKGCFEGLLAPRKQDTQYQGIMDGVEFEPFAILQGGYRSIRSLFVQEGDEISLLPQLPPEFHAGRLLNVKTKFGHFDLEWSKKSLKKVGLTPDKEEVRICLPKGLSTFRMEGERRRGGDPLILTPGKRVELDRFE